MTTAEQPTLFDAQATAVDEDDWVELRVGDDAFVSCRFCQLATTAAGIVRFEHGPGSRTCERYLAWPEDRS